MYSTVVKKISIYHIRHVAILPNENGDKNNFTD